MPLCAVLRTIPRPVAAGAQMQPAIRPDEFQPILLVVFGSWPRRVRIAGIARPPADGTDQPFPYAWHNVHRLMQALPATGEILENEGHADLTVTASHHPRINNPPLPSPPMSASSRCMASRTLPRPLRCSTRPVGRRHVFTCDWSRDCDCDWPRPTFSCASFGGFCSGKASCSTQN